MSKNGYTELTDATCESIMKRQDVDLNDISNMLKTTRHMALAISDELLEHNDALDMLNENTDHQIIIVESNTHKIKHIIENDKSYFCTILLLICILIFLVVLYFCL